MERGLALEVSSAMSDDLDMSPNVVYIRRV
jgi:hypothetical protein